MVAPFAEIRFQRAHVSYLRICQVPSIVVQRGSNIMERTVRTQRSLTKSEEFPEDHDQKKESSNKSGPPEPIGRSLSEDSALPPSNNNNTLHRSRSQNKVKLLVRSHAVREETSPPPDPFPDDGDQCNGSGASPKEQHSPQPHVHQQQPPIQQQTSISSRRHKLRREGSSQENWEHPPTLSRGNSREQYEGGNQIDLHQFIVETLNRNYKDRMLLIKIENDLISLAKDPKRTIHKFAQMSSYQRMLVHRVAAYFGMEHNVDTTGASVIVNTTKTTRIPDSRFREFVRDDLLLPEEPRRSILKRDSSSFDETGSFKSGDRMLGGESRRSKSFEEREEEYEKARRRIFNREHSQGDGDDCMDELQWENDEGVCSQCDHPNGRNPPRLLKVESYETSDTLRANSLRLSVSKSHSFNGYEPQTQTRILTKQDSGSSMSSRISPSSSGYKSQRSDATLSATPSPTATPNLHTQLSAQSGGALSPEPETVVWAVTDLASVPPGSMLIHPQTGQPYTNSDGSIYHYDPSNPPRMAMSDQASASQSSQVSQQQKHDGLDQNHVMNSNMPGGPPHHIHDISKPAMMDNGYADSSGGNTGGYLAPPPLCVGAPPPQHPYNPSQVVGPMHSGDGTVPPHYNPLVYPVHTTAAPPIPYPVQYDSRIQDGSVNANDLSNYMMGLSIDSSRPPDTRQIMYWPPHHVQSHPSVPVYYNNAGPNGGGAMSGARYPVPPMQPPQAPPPCPPASSQTGYAPAPPPPPPQTALVSAAPVPPPSAHISPDHAGCYSSNSYNSSQECIPYASPAVHMYYTHPYSSTSSGNVPTTGVASGASGYYSGNMPNCGGPVLAVQYQQPCPHPTPPHTPQGVCGQFTVYNGCYPGHYAQPGSTATLPVPQLFRKTGGLPVGARCVSPMTRPQYPVSPTGRPAPDRPQNDDKMPPPLPVYGFRVLPGEMRLVSNQGRIPFAIPASKGPHARKHRAKISNYQGRPNHSPGDVPVLHSANKV
ncbi:R3H domain [Nesidiocoris tenuis]|uniref:R3H domain n=1 Tax=Nesidiocoris tenuis TaxID=355587 RepID=A0ABN7AZ90_9HEMI|nr:R3H domain [Nesidiocoris tenuis]